MWIERQITRELQRIAAAFPAMVLTGPRQVGKTSLLERTFPDYTFVSMDSAENAEMAETRPRDFLLRYPPPVILDEIQYAPTFFRHIKTTIDARRGENGLFLLTGSQSFPLMEAVSDSLAGRAAVIQFLGLSSSEWSNATVISEKSDAEDFIWRGGFPELWATPDAPVSRDRWYQGYLATYLERDVRSLLNVTNLRDFERFIRACAARTAQTLNMSEIGRDVGISANAARQWISVLEASGQILLLEPYYRSLGKRLAKSPKLYFTDTGLAVFLMGYGSKESLWQSRDAGAVFENHVICQWLRKKHWASPAATLWYWRDRAGHEVDLLIEYDGKLTAVECKRSQKPSPRDITGIKKLIEFYGRDAFHHAFVACTTEERFDIADGITATSGFTTWDL
ncbi:MAG: ATP-binding protein [Myxococcota bacterium]|nr:ATP-binding protein [Myxococcota bacterium]